MIMGLPMVSLRKRLRSEGSRHGSVAVAADDAVLGNRDDEGDARGAAHTATAALMCGCGS